MLRTDLSAVPRSVASDTRSVGVKRVIKTGALFLLFVRIRFGLIKVQKKFFWEELLRRPSFNLDDATQPSEQ